MPTDTKGEQKMPAKIDPNNTLVLLILQAGATTLSALALCWEIAGDFRQPKSEQAMAILSELRDG
jgi:hypothetical protein